MNYTKYLVGLLILNFSFSLVSNMPYMGELAPSNDMSVVENTTASAENGATSVWDVTSYILDAVILALKITVLAPYYTGKTLELFGISPVVAWTIIGINYLVYVMWVIDIKRGKTFF
jgi:hypothetical protein